MSTMGSTQEAKLVDNMHLAVSYMNEGATPNDAIEKVARGASYDAELVKRLVEGVNKSLAVSTMKNASQDDRDKPFDLADASVIISNIYTEFMPKVAHQVTLPSRDFSELGIRTAEVLDKVASATEEPERMYVHTAAKMLEKHASFFDKAEQVLSQKVAESEHRLIRNIDDAVTALRPLSRYHMKKVAQNVVNKYPISHGDMLDILRNHGSLEIPELQKSASYCIFPEVEPYLTINRLHTSARELSLLEKEVTKFKEAAAGSGSSLKSTLGGAATSALGLGAAMSRMEDRAGKGPEPTLKYIDPSILNKLKELEARRNLMEIVLHDPDMKAYPFHKLIGSYNSAVSNVNDAYKHPNVLKNLMLQTLEGGDVKDVATLKQETDVAKNLKAMNPDSADSAKEIMGA